jgi:hypothetical protein
MTCIASNVFLGLVVTVLAECSAITPPRPKTYNISQA